MKVKLIILIIIALSLNVNSQELQTRENFRGYIPASITNISNVGISFKDEFGQAFNITTLDLSDFNHITTSVTLINNKDELGGFGVTYEKGIYRVVYSFEVYVEAFDSHNKKYRIGASIEAIANIKTNKKKLDLSNLFNLAIVAEKNKLSGSLTLTAKGFNSDTIYNMFNIGGSIDKASVQNVLKNVGIMISKFTDNTIDLKPVILGVETMKEK